MEPLWPSAWLHCDMDAFFAAVEQLDFPELRGKPTIICGDPGSRSVVCAVSYEARFHGVKSAMPTRMAMQLCPHGQFRRPRFRRYLEISDHMNAIFHRYSPKVEPVSIDESYIDVTGSQRLLGSPGEIGERIKADVLNEIGITVSIGVAATRFVAKMGSRADKPDGIVVIPPGRETEFLWPIPIGKMWGVGDATRNAMLSLGITTIGELANHPAELLFRKFGKVGLGLRVMANGGEMRFVHGPFIPRSVTNSTTLTRNTTDLQLLGGYILYLSHLVGYRLRRQRLVGSTIVLKGKWEDMRAFNRNAKLPYPTDIDLDIAAAARDLLNREPLVMPIRNIGVGVTNICSADVPPLLIEARRMGRLDRAFDKIEDKHGDGKIARLGVLMHVERPRGDHPFIFADRARTVVE